jgi:hypothetical protein
VVSVIGGLGPLTDPATIRYRYYCAAIFPDTILSFREMMVNHFRNSGLQEGGIGFVERAQKGSGEIFFSIFRVAFLVNRVLVGRKSRQASSPVSHHPLISSSKVSRL